MNKQLVCVQTSSPPENPDLFSDFQGERTSACRLQASKQASKQAGKQASRQAGKQASRQAGRQPSKQAGKQASNIIKCWGKWSNSLSDRWSYVKRTRRGKNEACLALTQFLYCFFQMTFFQHNPQFSIWVLQKMRTKNEWSHVILLSTCSLPTKNVFHFGSQQIFSGMEDWEQSRMPLKLSVWSGLYGPCLLSSSVSVFISVCLSFCGFFCCVCLIFLCICFLCLLMYK